MNLHRTEPGLTVGNCLISTVPLLATVVFALSVDRLSADVALSFVVLGLAVSLHCLQAIRGRANSAADASVFVFGLMFLLVAPIVQLSVLGYKLVNTTYAQADLLVETNLACSLFIGVYLLARITVLKPPPPTDFVRDLAPPTAGISAFSMTAFIGISVFIALFSLPFIGAGVADQSLTPVLLGFRKFLFFVPTALFLIVLADYTSTARKHSFLQLLLLVLMFLCVLATQNPATEKRNGLGPVYLAMIFLMFRGRFQRTGVQVGWLTGVLLVLFPLTAVLTVIPWKYLDEVDLKWSLFTDHFLVTHYDAWANIYTSIEMVGRNGLSAGKQLGGCPAVLRAQHLVVRQAAGHRHRDRQLPHHLPPDVVHQPLGTLDRRRFSGLRLLRCGRLRHRPGRPGAWHRALVIARPHSADPGHGRLPGLLHRLPAARFDDDRLRLRQRSDRGLRAQPRPDRTLLTRRRAPPARSAPPGLDTGGCVTAP